MKLNNLVEAEGDPEWTNSPEDTDIYALERKVKSLDHQGDLMMRKLDLWTKHAPGKVFATTGMKSGMKAPKPVETDPRRFLTWTLTHSNPNIATKVYADRNDPKVVLPIRALVTRHNDLTNARAEAEGRLVRLKAEWQKRIDDKKKGALK